ncbi:MAG TPA: sigma-70 family RNA polymerase sigma factor [bacterium]|nr:sigma-70 family RNA polymerase sigma factor [bacterium]HMW33812.1 sigma-70 family RNA polymerase sigma factor [bacterium]HMW37531.1 sigma-70 family RNA polymerase sigma factor [bacterium]HMY36684.1 sigma-70 family RNA polymerase sigma factor [bacterium]HMZ04525.1 sigma-70 family RNA polymerase sigma factor [bacterium]
MAKRAIKKNKPTAKAKRKPVQRSLKTPLQSVVSEQAPSKPKLDDDLDIDVPITPEDPNRLLLEKREKQKKEDFEFIARAVGGDQKAFELLMNRYRPQIFGLMYRMVHKSEEAEDLVQEAFMKAFTSLSNFNYEYAFSTWLYKIATNNCIDHLRKKKLQTYSIDAPVQYKDSEYQIEIPDLTYHPEKEMMRNERTQMIKGAIEELPEKYKRVIFLRHSEELSYEEISEMLNIPIGTVKARIFRAREMLNKFLKGKIDKVL